MKSASNYSKTKTFTCKFCGDLSPCRYTGKNIYCSRTCAGKDMVDSRKEQCSRPEVIEKISKGWFKKGASASPDSQFKTGHTPWHKGKTNVYTEEQLGRITEANRNKANKTAGENNWQWKGGKSKCHDCNKVLTYYKSKSTGRCRDCNSLYYSGDKAWGWKGGKTTDNLKQRVKFRRLIQRQVLERDNYTCVSCSKRGVVLHVDHIKSWAEYPELRFDMSNCRTLCMKCHYFVTFNSKMPDGIVWGNNLSRRME